MVKKANEKAESESLVERFGRLADEEERRLAKEADPKLRMSITRTVTLLLDAQRKAEVAQQKATDAITKPAIIEFVRRMDEGERVRFVKELQQLTTKKSGLA
jgi:hypothetical protein